MKRNLYCLVAVVLLAGMLLGCAPAPTPAPTPTPTPIPKPEPIVLKATTLTPPSHVLVEQGGTLFFIEQVNMRAKGELVIEYLGGPEAIPSFDQPKALQSGVIDICYTAGGYYADQLPEVGALQLTKLTPWEEREVGFYDLFNKLHEKIGMFYLGKADRLVRLYIITNKKVNSPQELAGQRMRMLADYEPFVKELGMSGVVMSMPDIYTALDRGTIDGLIHTPADIADFSWYEVCNYFIDHPFWDSTCVLLMNLDSWNELPPHLQDVMMEAVYDTEYWVYGSLRQVLDESLMRIKDAGMEFIKFSPEDAEYYIWAAYEPRWESVVQKSPETGPIIRKMLSR